MSNSEHQIHPFEQAILDALRVAFPGATAENLATFAQAVTQAGYTMSPLNETAKKMAQEYFETLKRVGSGPTPPSVLRPVTTPEEFKAHAAAGSLPPHAFNFVRMATAGLATNLLHVIAALKGDGTLPHDGSLDNVAHQVGMTAFVWQVCAEGERTADMKIRAYEAACSNIHGRHEIFEQAMNDHAAKQPSGAVN